MCNYRHYDQNYFLTEVYPQPRHSRGFGGFYVEHKNVFGLTVRATVDNVLNGRHTLDRSRLHRLSRPRAARFLRQATTSWSGRFSAFSVKGTF